MHDFDISVETFADFREHCSIKTGRRIIGQNQIHRRQVARYANLERFCAVNLRNVDFRNFVGFNVGDVFVDEFIKRAVRFHFADSFVQIGFKLSVVFAHGEAECVGEFQLCTVTDKSVFVIGGNDVFADTIIGADLVDVAGFDAHLHCFQAVIKRDVVFGEIDTAFFVDVVENVRHLLFVGVQAGYHAEFGGSRFGSFSILIAALRAAATREQCTCQYTRQENLRNFFELH